MLYSGAPFWSRLACVGAGCSGRLHSPLLCQERPPDRSRTAGNRVAQMLTQLDHRVS